MALCAGGLIVFVDVGVEVRDVEVGAEARNMDRGWLLGSCSAISSCGKGFDTGFRDKASGALFWTPFTHWVVKL